MSKFNCYFQINCFLQSFIADEDTPPKPSPDQEPRVPEPEPDPADAMEDVPIEGLAEQMEEIPIEEDLG